LFFNIITMVYYVPILSSVKIISYTVSIICYICCYICCSLIYFATQVFKIDVPIQRYDNTENKDSEYVDNCMHVNDSYFSCHHDQSNK
jgi:phosphotransferase system  glucose/maltose/N-acetylglucosamine-specific IIC component